MDLKHLSDSDLMEATVCVAGTERRACVNLLFHLVELDIRQCFIARGPNSLYDYCEKELKLSDGAASPTRERGSRDAQYSGDRTAPSVGSA